MQYEKPAIRILIAGFFLIRDEKGQTISTTPKESPVSGSAKAFPPKPTWRGVSHQCAFFVSLVTGFWLVHFAWQQSAGSTQSYLYVASVAVFVASAALLFGTSALYHRVQWGASARELMRRCDHSSIYLLISGTYTPVMLLTIELSTATKVLAVVWGATALGIFLELAVKRAPKWLKAGMYVAIGWVGVAVTPEIYASAGVLIVALIALGGCLYTIGAVIYAAKKPNFHPTVFGYHEYFHMFVIAGVVSHYSVVFLLLERL